MSASGAGGPRVNRLFERAADADNIGVVVFRGLGAILFAIGTAIASGILTLADVFIVPAQAFIGAIGDLITAIFGGAATIIDLGALASAISLGPQGLFASPISFAVAIAVVLLGLYVFIAFISEPETTNVPFLPGSGLDVPTPGFTDSEEESGDD